MKIYLLVLLLTITTITYVDSIKCHVCPRVTETCKLDNAELIECGKNGICLTQIRKDATDRTLAIRKCGVPDAKTKQVQCPSDSDCTQCDNDGCSGANSINSQLTFGIITTITTMVFMKFVF